METREFDTRSLNGWASLFVLVLLGAGLAYVGYDAISNVVASSREVPRGPGVADIAYIVGWGLPCAVWVLLMFGFFTLQPNLGAVLILFGKYKGTVQGSGLAQWNPLP